MRVLVAIAHHGQRNRQHLLRMLREFRSMDHDVDVVVLSEAEKPLPDEVEIRVGLPSDDPWSLPFAHQPLFQERRDQYDLFVYSEDDTLIEQRHLDSYVDLSSRLPEPYVPGFMRFEEQPDGRRSYCTIHSHYRWDVGSVFVQDGLTFAHFTNEHGACYALTRAQLGNVIASGGFLVPPHRGRYDMLVSAATAPYVRCGLRKVFCLERIEDQLVHHLPNVYLGKLGVTQEEFETQLAALMALPARAGDGQLLRTETSLDEPRWNKSCFPRAPERVADLVGPAPARVLSFGAVNGALERELQKRGHDVLAIPVDEVFGALLEHGGIATLPPRVPSSEELASVAPADVLLAVDTFGYLADPVAALRALLPAIGPGGRVVATAPDHRRQWWREALPGGRRRSLPRSWVDHGLHPTDPGQLRRWLRDAGCTGIRTHHRRASRVEPVGASGVRGRVLGNTVLATARPDPARVRSAPTVGSVR